MSVSINIEGLKEIIERMQQFPEMLEEESKVVMHASLEVLHENVPPYPQVPNPTRTGTLGRTLGASMEGGAMGTPNIFEVVPLGQGNVSGRFGTNLNYAPYVIGEEQAWMHYRWWRIKEIASAAEEKIVSLWRGLIDDLAAFLEG